MDWIGLDWIGLKDWVGLTGMGINSLGLDWDVKIDLGVGCRMSAVGYPGLVFSTTRMHTMLLARKKSINNCAHPLVQKLV